MVKASLPQRRKGAKKDVFHRDKALLALTALAALTALTALELGVFLRAFAPLRET